MEHRRHSARRHRSILCEAFELNHRRQRCGSNRMPVLGHANVLLHSIARMVKCRRPGHSCSLGAGPHSCECAAGQEGKKTKW
jgi:hypothetical protein